ncbi:thioredoxin-like protein [Macrolepiota fuliginosa MF-IS2]|uniref:Thioredoxin-like protein n=1 Tax=Macrolepiota fuliginosa MF-IS2 TaxID=1400762 RepID=A0A9P5XN22_9AGAR|nr:thioredoxin-like protein [Macrolepiota fuliginosa MF-IS2]
MKLTLQLFALALTPSLALAAIFPPNSNVKMLNPKSFKKALKANQTSMIAFVAPWCGHCQRMAPEYAKAADKLHPLIPTYAIDCDDDKNKPLCAEQQVQGFPTVKLFPRGNKVAPMTYDSGDRTASALFNWASRRVPNHVTKLSKINEIQSWSEKTQDKTTLLLLTKEKKVPLLWKVLANRYSGKLELAAHRDEDGEATKALGFDEKVKVLVYPSGSSTPVKYEGTTKLEPLTKFFDSILDGTVDFKIPDGEKTSERAGDEL